MTERLILITEAPVPEDVIDGLRETAAGFEIIAKADLADELLARAEVVAGHLSPERLDIAKALRWNHLWTAGTDADLPQRMVDSDIVLTSSAGNGAVPLAEHALLLMMMLGRDMPRWTAAQSARRWERFRHGELAGKTVGIVGMGKAGQDLAVKCHAFHMRVLGLRSRPEKGATRVEHMYGPTEIVEFAAACDFLFVAAPLVETTRGMIDESVFAAMKPSAFIVNVSRGEIIDEPAMLAAVTEGRIAGAGLDAHREEPLPENSPWWSLPNVVVTPHNGATTPQTVARGMDIFVENVNRYVTGGRLLNVVDKNSGYAPV
ncbi:D-2-hydroxyacid dehydrogenase [Actinomadura vinacea]|uniref:D-2-hydroxyacid dehydrogenase n=1 Tax=Actinomadura vinacea TaxID=115336 RepID=A0ABP5XP63_9ACTN